MPHHLVLVLVLVLLRSWQRPRQKGEEFLSGGGQQSQGQGPSDWKSSEVTLLPFKLWSCCSHAIIWFIGVVVDAGESQSNTANQIHPSLQCSGSNVGAWWLARIVYCSAQDTLCPTYTRLQMSTSVFLNTHTGQTARGTQGECCWIWQQMWIIIKDYTFKYCKTLVWPLSLLGSHLIELLPFYLL